MDQYTRCIIQFNEETEYLRFRMMREIENVDIIELTVDIIFDHYSGKFDRMKSRYCSYMNGIEERAGIESLKRTDES